MSILKKLVAASATGLGGALIMTASASALVQTSDIADGAVTFAKIATNTITAGNLHSKSVETNALVNGAVTEKKIANGAVTTKKIGDGSVTGAKIASDAAINLDTGSVTAGNNGPSATAGTVTVDNTRPTGATGSFQSVAGDVTYNGAAGGTSDYHAGVMGNFHGDALTNSHASYHAGVIGSYNVTTSDANPGAQAGVVGEVGDLAVASGTNAFTAVLGGDGGAMTPDAAYGVAYFNSNSGSKFTYGLDLKRTAIGSYQAVTYGTADIRLQNGATISNGTNNVVNFAGATSIGIPSAAQGLTDNTGSCTTGRVTYDSTNNHFFGCVNGTWQQLD